MSVSTKSYKRTRDRISVKHNDIKPHFNVSIHKGSFQEKILSLKNIGGYRVNYPDRHLRVQYDRSVEFRRFNVGPTPTLV